MSGSADLSIRVWDYKNSQILFGMPSAHNSKIECIRLMQNGENYLSSADDSQIKMWSATSYTLVSTLSGHTSNVNALQIMTNGLIVSGSSDYTVKVWNQTTGTNILSFNPFGDAVVCIKEISSGIFAVAGLSESVYIYFTNGTLIYTFESILATQCNAMTVYNHKILAIGQESGTLLLYDVSSVKAPVKLTSITRSFKYVYSLESFRRFFDIF